MSALITVTISLVHNIHTKNITIRRAILTFRANHGNNITLHVRRRNLQIPCLGRLKSIPIKYDKLLQSPNNLAQSHP